MGGGSVCQQFAALMRRNILLKWRKSKGQVVLEFLIPVFFVAFLALLTNLTTPRPGQPVSFLPVNLRDSVPIDRLFRATFYVSPDTDASITIVRDALEIIGVTTSNILQFRNASDSEDSYMKALSLNNSNIAESLLIIGVDFAEGKTMNYTIRFPPGELPDTQGTHFDYGIGCRESLDYCPANKYLHSNFAILQWGLDTAIIRNATGISEFGPPEIQIQLMPKLTWVPSLTFIQSFVSIYMVFAYSFIVNFLLVGLVTEKESKLKEAMRIMGMKDSAFWLSWGVTYVVIILVDSILCTIIAGVANLLVNSNMFIFFLAIFLYGLSIITLSFALTPFFTKADSAGGLGSLATVVFSLIYLAVSLTRNGYNEDGPLSTVPAGGQWALSLLSPIALALTLDQAIYLDVVRGGMNFHNLRVGQFPVYAGLTMLAVDVVLYALLAVYFDNVIQGEYGSRRPPLFFLSSSYWCSGLKQKPNRVNWLEHGAEAGSKINQEDVHHSLHGKNTLRIFNIKKEFTTQKKTLAAVDGFTLDIYEGQITALLGHNGAGKSTLINILTGMTRPTSGTATIAGWDVSDSVDMDEIRQMTGVCPQHNILFNELTCREHLQLFGRLRGIAESNINEQLPNQLAEVDMKEKIDTYAKDLSGGQKRKLSLAIALVGDPKIIFLDEPTAGMDPSTRRGVWNLLKSKRTGRVVLLTTHFMDEADILADRKAIMSKGQLKCVGSSLYLKNRFGLGYHLGLVVKPGSNHDAVSHLVTHHVPTASLTRIHIQELVFTLPLSESDKFPGLLGAIEGLINTQDPNVDIISYGISMTSLEEVFLKIGEDEDTIHKESEDDVQDLTRFISTATNRSLNQPQSANTINNSLGDLSRIPTYSIIDEGLRSQQFWAFFKLRLMETSRNPASFFFRIIFPGIFVLVSAGLNFGLSQGSTDGSAPGSPSKLQINAGMYAFVKADLNSTYNPNAIWQVNGTGGINLTRFLVAMEATGIGLSSLPVGINLSLVAPHHLGTVVQDVTTNALDVKAALTLLYNDTAFHSLPATSNLVSNALLNFMDTNSSSISLSNQPWPDLNPPANWGALSSLGSMVLLGIALSTVPSAFASGIVRDRETKCRTQLRVCGITMNTYWSVLIMADLIQYCLPSVMCLVVYLAFQTKWLLQGGAALATVLLLLVFMPLNTLFSYNCSFAFTKKQTCMAVLPSICIWVPMLPYVAIAVVDIANSEVATILHLVFCFLIPPYTLFGGLHFIAKVYRQAVLEEGDNPIIPVSRYFEPANNILPALLIPILHILLLYILLRVLEVRSNGGSCSAAVRCSSNSSKLSVIPLNNSYTMDDEDEDVAAERQRVEHIQSGQAATIVKNLQKKFPKNTQRVCQCTAPDTETTHVAVKNATFAVKAGEVFGLLGPNGAGKSTTLNAMTAEITPSSGAVIVDGYNIHSNLTDAYKRIGYCPQEDALWEFNTLKEHLMMYAAARGIRKQDIEPLVTFYLRALDIEEHAKKISKNLSGGTKRKLSLVISLLGKPRVVLMDEPSTGMDPKSKRFLWDTISSGFHGSDKAAVLTTHYMDEADALSTRVGIMVNGALVALGSTQHLKNKYGSGYVLEMKLATQDGDSDDRFNAVKNFVASILPSSELMEKFGERLVYKVPQTNIKAVSKIFSALEQEKDTFGIEEYSFSQSTLEQVFLELAKQQADEEDEEQKWAVHHSHSRLVSPSHVEHAATTM